MEISTGSRNTVLTALKTELEASGGSNLYVYSGTVPSSPNDAVTPATLLATFSLNGAGSAITFGSPVAGVMSKSVSETWSSTVASSGTATYYRYKLISDTDALSTTAPRLQGTVGTANADLLVDTTTFTAAETRTISSYSVGMPEE